MPESVIPGCRLLVVEDDYFWADELSRGLRRAGANLLGPVGTVEAAMALLRDGPMPEAAVIDMNLRGERAYPVIDRLHDSGVPFLIVTGYDDLALPAPYAPLPRMEKPVTVASVLTALDALMTASLSPTP